MFQHCRGKEGGHAFPSSRSPSLSLLLALPPFEQGCGADRHSPSPPPPAFYPAPLQGEGTVPTVASNAASEAGRRNETLRPRVRKSNVGNFFKRGEKKSFLKLFCIRRALMKCQTPVADSDKGSLSRGSITFTAPTPPLPYTQPHLYSE